MLKSLLFESVLNLLSLVLSHLEFSWLGPDENVEFCFVFEVILFEATENNFVLQNGTLEKNRKTLQVNINQVQIT